MKDAALRVGRGELDTRITIQSDDEVGILAQAFNQMVADLATTQEAVRQSEERFRVLTMQAPVGIFLTDGDGNCLFVNEGWCKLARMGAEEAQGQGWLGAIHAEERQRVFHESHHATQDGHPSPANTAFIRRMARPSGSLALRWLCGMMREK